MIMPIIRHQDMKEIPNIVFQVQIYSIEFTLFAYERKKEKRGEVGKAVSVSLGIHRLTSSLY